MSQFTNTSLSGYHTYMLRFVHRLRRLSRFFRPTSISKLLFGLERATTPQQLTKSVNQVKDRLWQLSEEEQAGWREKLTAILHAHVLHGPQAPLRLEAAGWLRFLTQAGLVTKPQEVFVTLVTSAMRLQTESAEAVRERRAYLKMIFECFWPFRYPYPAFSWQMFPDASIFSPLALLFEKADDDVQDTLISIFAELPVLDDSEIVDHLLPVALVWAEDSDVEHRRRIAPVLARIRLISAQEALQRLQSDPHPLVRASAKNAASSIRGA
jgi:hypothetical protein